MVKLSLFLTALPGFTRALPLESKADVRHQSRVPVANAYFAYSTSDPGWIQDGIGAGPDVYVPYIGDGSPAAGWPTMADWVSFEDMFWANVPVMKNGCEWLSMPASFNTLDDEIPLIRDAIQATAEDTGVDHRFILAVMMQESLGCVRVYTTMNANPNPGLMQDHAGTATCNAGSKWAPADVQTPCPYDAIYNMIQGGVGGTPSGDGLATYLNDAVARMQALSNVVVNGSNAQIHYQAARQYNSGSVDPTNLSNGYQSTNCYASDIANRLTGWVQSPTTCYL